MKLMSCLLSCLLLVSDPVHAAADAPAVDPERATEAGLLLDMMSMDETMNVTVALMLDAQIEIKPELEPYRKIMADFFNRHMGYASLRDDMIAIYASEFTAEELRITREYYATAAGQKFLRSMPRLVQLGAELGERKVTQNLPELESLIKAERARLQSLEAIADVVDAGFEKPTGDTAKGKAPGPKEDE